MSVGFASIIGGYANCLSFFELQLLVTPLVSSNFSYKRKLTHKQVEMADIVQI
jgi:hypothetical protein